MSSEATRPQAETRIITVKGQRLRVAIRPGDGTRTPLLLMNGIGINLEALQPFVDALDPAIEVIRSADLHSSLLFKTLIAAGG